MHGDSLYRSETRVPLLIMMPWSRPSRNIIRDTVSLRALPATIVDLVDLEQGSPFTSDSLARMWEGTGSADLPSEFAVSELASPNPTDPNQGRSPARHGPLLALSKDRYTYLRGEKSEELYDEVSDPAEKTNLAGDESTKPVLERFRVKAARIHQPGPH